MTYTVRHPPFGIAVLVSNDEGQTWSEPMALISDAPTADVGLSQTLELEPHRFLTFYYQDDQATTRTTKPRRIGRQRLLGSSGILS